MEMQVIETWAFRKLVVVSSDIDAKRTERNQYVGSEESLGSTYRSTTELHPQRVCWIDVQDTDLQYMKLPKC